MKWQPVKRLVKISSILLLLFVITIVIISLFLNKLLPKESLKIFIVNYFKNSLKCEIKLGDIYVNLLKGLVINDIHIYPEIGNYSNEFKIDKIVLIYDFKDLVSKFRIEINKILIKNIEATFDKQIIIDKLKLIKSSSSQTNIQNRSGLKILIDFNEIEVLDSELKYIYENKPVGLNLARLVLIIETNNRLKFKGNYFINYDSKELNGEVRGALGTKEEDVTLFLSYPEFKSRCELNVQSTNKINHFIKINLHIKEYPFKISSELSFSNNYVSITNFEISDLNSFEIYCKNIGFDLNKKIIKASGEIRLSSFDDLKFYKIEKLKFNINADIFFNSKIFINNLQKSIINGSLDLKNSVFEYINHKVKIENLNGKLLNSKLEGSGKAILDEKVKTDFKVILKNLILYDRDLYISGIMNGVKLRDIITNYKIEIEPSNILYEIKYNAFANLIEFEKLELIFDKGRVNLKGRYKKGENNNFILDFNKLPSGYFITNKELYGDLSGKIESTILFYSNGFILKELNGKLFYNGALRVKESYGLNLTMNCFLKENKIIVENGLAEFENNDVIFNGEYDIKNRKLLINGECKNFNLNSLKIGKLDGFGNIKFKVNDKNNIEFYFSGKRVNRDFWKFENVGMQLFLTNNTYSGKFLSDFCKGRIEIKFAGLDESINITGQGRDILLEELPKEFLEGEIGGLFNFEIKGNYNNKSSELVLYFTGKAEKGEIKETKIQNNLSSFLKLLPLQDIFYKIINVNLILKNDELNIDNIRMIGYDQSYEVKGLYNIKTKRLKLNIYPQFSEEFVMNVPNFILPVINKKNGWYYIKGIDYIRETDGSTKLNWSLK